MFNSMERVIRLQHQKVRALDDDISSLQFSVGMIGMEEEDGK
jgi:hypothetical protein